MSDLARRAIESTNRRYLVCRLLQDCWLRITAIDEDENEADGHQDGNVPPQYTLKSRPSSVSDKDGEREIGFPYRSDFTNVAQHLL